MSVELFLKCQAQIGLQAAIAILNSDSVVMEQLFIRKVNHERI